IYSRLGHTTLDIAPITLDELVRETLFQLGPELKERKAEIEIVAPLPCVLGHRTTLQQVFTNLISNGTKFVGKGTIPKVRIASETNKQTARIAIADNGIGIASEDQPRIFRVFERLHSIDEYPGTGVGLAIVRKGLERMGGRISLESEVGKGSVFTLELPVA
ncbi:MAG: ATP-binding protein, partial [Verrucomicrobiota bacterium]|nr:ATP-binding protein [Verrucomicrobiota bacterium]